MTWPNIFEDHTIQQRDSIGRSGVLSRFVIKNHYLKSLARGCKRNFILSHNRRVYGVAMFGHPIAKEHLEGTIELKRFVLAPKAPKNVASWFLAKCIRELQKDPSICQIISYADSEQGHEGIIYKASNFQDLGVQKQPSQVIQILGTSKRIHTRAAYQKLNGKYTTTALKTQKLLREGKAKNITLPKKKIFWYPFR